MRKMERERVSEQRGNLSRNSLGVRYREGVHEASGVAENPRGDCQGVGGGVESPSGTNTPGVEELPRGDKSSGVTLEGNGVTGSDRQGRGGDGNSPST